MSIPYVQVSFNGQVVSLTQAQTEQALRDARLCQCGTCLCCHVAQYVKSNER